MASSMSLKLACVLILCLAVAALQAQGTITCGLAVSSLAHCIVYVRNNCAGGGVPATCCNGIKYLSTASRSTPDRQSACNCIKGVVAGIPSKNYGLANKHPVRGEHPVQDQPLHRLQKHQVKLAMEVGQQIEGK